jgi:three-Cys-motif partner protein
MFYCWGCSLRGSRALFTGCGSSTVSTEGGNEPEEAGPPGETAEPVVMKNQAREHRFGGRWTDEKLEVIRKYLLAYTQVLKHKRLTLFYIDAFAGTGDRTTERHREQMLFELPELDSMTKGSARVALEIEPPFHEYIFIEKSRRHASALEQLKNEYPSRNIKILNEDANEAIQRICREQDWRFNRAVLFLDPYGMQVSWETLHAAAATKAMDVWVLFPSGMGMNRLITNSGAIPAEWQDTLDRFLGCSDWRDHFYRVTETTNLFGETTTDVVKEADTRKFEQFFLDRLRTIFTAVAPESVPLVNGRGQIMYLLCFACGNPRGAAIAVKIARSVIRGAVVEKRGRR